MGIVREDKGGAGLEKQLSCPKIPLTFDTFYEILKSLNLLQNSSYNTLQYFNHTLNARDFAGLF